MTIFAWVLMVLSGICLIFAIPSIVNSKFLVGLITLASNAATVFYFVSYLFLDIGSVFNILTWVLLAVAVLCAITLLASKSEGSVLAAIFYVAQIVFYIVQLIK